MSAVSENIIGNCNTMEEIRKAVQENTGMKEDLEDSTEFVKVLMSSVFQRLVRSKGLNFFPAACTHEVEAFFSKLCDIDR